MLVPYQYAKYGLAGPDSLWECLAMLDLCGSTTEEVAQAFGESHRRGGTLHNVINSRVYIFIFNNMLRVPRSSSDPLAPVYVSSGKPYEKSSAGVIS